MGRPSEYDPQIAVEFLTEISTTRAGIQTICARNDFPEPKTLYKWMMENPPFLQAYARAKEEQLQILEDEILEIADNTKLGEIVTLKADGTEERKMADMIEHRKLQIESRKWLMAKLKPKKYGEKIQQELTGDLSLTLADTISKARKRLE